MGLRLHWSRRAVTTRSSSSSSLPLSSLPPPFKKELEMGWTQDGFMEVECLSVDCHWAHLPPLYKENRKDSELKKTSLNSGNRTMGVYG